MTTVCGGGTSGPKTGVAAVVDYSSGLIASLLAARGLNWLIPVIPLAGLPPLILSTFCASDPPAVPTFTAAEANAIIELQLGADFNSGVSKLADMILHNIWYDACHCTSGTLTAFPTVTPPTGTVITQPPVAPTMQPCVSVHNTNGTIFGPGDDLSLGGANYRGRNATSAFCTFSTTVATAGGGTYDFQIQWLDGISGHSPIRTDHTTLGAASSTAINLTPAAGAIIGQMQVTTLTGTGSSHCNASIDIFCNGDVVGGIQQPCCPPDVATQASLDLILKMVTLIQRQIVPFGYVPSTVHSAVSGAGSISIAGLIGIKVDVTTLPAPVGREGTSPTEYFDMGFLTFGTADGYPQSYRLERSTQLLLPARCSAFTSLAYDLHPAVVVDITELLREP